MLSRNTVITSALIFLTGLGAGIIIHGEYPIKVPRGESTAVREGQQSFINPLLECEAADGLANNELQPFKDELTKLSKELISKKLASEIGIYFRDLNNGPWIGVNEKLMFSPASLLKAPIMISALKQAELHPDFLQTQVIFRGSKSAQTQYYPPSQTMQVGKSYSIDEIIRRMIVYSDNDAKDLLLSKMDGNILIDTYSDLGVTPPSLEKTDDFMTVRGYASFFRILFNASYLSQEMSNKALSLLSQSEFNLGLTAKINPKIKVAHKFGERIFQEMDQLHDCGIIYYPSRPYLLCVMSRGENFDQMADNIAKISKFVYNEVDKQTK